MTIKILKSLLLYKYLLMGLSRDICPVWRCPEDFSSIQDFISIVSFWLESIKCSVWSVHIVPGTPMLGQIWYTCHPRQAVVYFSFSTVLSVSHYPTQPNSLPQPPPLAFSSLPCWWSLNYWQRKVQERNCQLTWCVHQRIKSNEGRLAQPTQKRMRIFFLPSSRSLLSLLTSTKSG